MGQLALAIKQASETEGAPISDEMLKEAELSLDDVVDRFSASGDLAKEVEGLGGDIGGMPVGWRSFLKAVGGGALLGIPAVALVAALKKRSFEKAEKRRKKLMTEYLDTERAGAKLKLPKQELEVPIKAASEKEAGYGLPIALAGGALMSPLIYKYVKNLLGGMDLKGALGNLFQPTDNPITHPLGASMLVGLPITAAGLTSHFAGKHYDELRKKRIERERAQAEEEFQKALESEYSGQKVASLAERVDHLADIFSRGNFTKIAEIMQKKANGEGWGDPVEATTPGPWTGAGSGIAGLYLLSLMMLTGAAGAGAWRYAKKHDEGRKRSQTLERLLKRRALATPTPLVAYRKDPGEKETIAEEPI